MKITIAEAFENAATNKKYGDEIANRLMEYAPSGGGFDAGTVLEKLTPSKIVFSTSFHHMDDFGHYDGWTEHKVTVTANFKGFEVTVSGKNKNQIKDYIADVFHEWLSSEVNVSFTPGGVGMWKVWI